MTRTHRWATTKERAQEKRVEKRVWKFFAGLSHQAAVVTSVRVAMQLANLWDVEKAAIDSRGDDPFVYTIRDEDREWLASAVASCCRNSVWSSCPHECVGRMLTSEVSVDVAAFSGPNSERDLLEREVLVASPDLTPAEAEKALEAQISALMGFSVPLTEPTVCPVPTAPRITPTTGASAADPLDFITATVTDEPDQQRVFLPDATTPEICDKTPGQVRFKSSPSSN